MPYAAKAKIEHEFDTDHLNVWLTFRHPMDQSVKPTHGLWTLTVDDIEKNISSSAWQDEFTLLLVSDEVLAWPSRVLLAYDGPSGNLQTTWGKDWEPWGDILSIDLKGGIFTTGMIQLWSGAVVDIPSGWQLCDGTNGTPDLRDKFIVGAGSTYAPNDSGGETSHNHGGICAPTSLTLGAGTDINTGTDLTKTIPWHIHTVAVSYRATLPPYYALCYIMKL